MRHLQVVATFQRSACLGALHAEAILTSIYRVDGVVISADAMVRAPGLVDAS